MIFLGNYGVDFRDLGISLLKEYGAIMLVFIMVVVIYGIAFLGIKLGPQNAAYLFFFKMICVISAILACELLAYILGHLRFVLDKFMWKSSRGAASQVQAKIYVLLYHPTTLGLNMFHNRFKKIYIAFKNMSFNRQHKESRSRWWWSDCRYCLIGPAIFVWLSKKSLLLGFPAIL